MLDILVKGDCTVANRAEVQFPLGANVRPTIICTGFGSGLVCVCVWGGGGALYFNVDIILVKRNTLGPKLFFRTRAMNT